MQSQSPLAVVYVVVAAVAGTVSLVAIIVTRQLLSEWRVVCICWALFLLPLTLYGWVVIASMTNPPVNWGYAKTVDGFLHVLRRGQYERFVLGQDPGAFLKTIGWYFKYTLRDLGWGYFIAAFVSFAFLAKLRGFGHRWLLGLMSTLLPLCFITLWVLNPPPDIEAMDMARLYFLPSHLVLTICAGYGLVLAGSRAALRRGVPIAKSIKS